MDFKHPRDIDMQTMIEGIVHSLHNEHRGGLPARIESYDATNIRANVTPMMMRIFLDENDNEVPTPYPVISNVPVAFPRGGGAFLSFPLAKGDLVPLLPAERSLDNWKESDGKSALDPQDARRMHLTDMVAFAGLNTSVNHIPNASATDVVLGLENGNFVLHIQPGGSLLMGTATANQALALATVANTRMGNIESTFNSHTHVAPTLGGVTAGPVPGMGTGPDCSSARAFVDK